jgi:hypothetical protein
MNGDAQVYQLDRVYAIEIPVEMRAESFCWFLLE